MYLTIHEMRIRNQESAVRSLASKYLDVESSIASVIQQLGGEWSGSGADAQIEKLKDAIKELEATRAELSSVASLLNQYCVNHRTVWEELEKLVTGGD